MSDTAFGARIFRPGRVAVIVVDATNGFTRPGGPLSCEAGEAVAAIASLVEHARRGGIPIVYTRVSFDSTVISEGAALFRAKVPALMLLEDSWEAAVDERVSPASGDLVITKELASGFYGTDLEGRLRQAEVEVLVITGFSTSGCVRATVVDSLQRGFVPVVVADAVGDRDAESHRVALREMDARYADVVDLQTAIALLSSAPDS